MFTSANYCPGKTRVARLVLPGSDTDVPLNNHSGNSRADFTPHRGSMGRYRNVRHAVLVIPEPSDEQTEDEQGSGLSETESDVSDYSMFSIASLLNRPVLVCQ